MKDIYEALESRMKSPFVGYFLIALVGLNWKPLYFLFISSVPATDRIAYFEAHSSWQSLVLWPLLLTLLYPWFNLAFSFLSNKPLELKNNIQAKSEHSLLLKRQELEEIRSQMLSKAEEVLIERAKREEDIESIENEEIKEKVKSEIDQLRAEGASESDAKVSASLDNQRQRLLDMAKHYRESAKSADFPESSDLLKKANELEAKVHRMLLNEPEF